MNIEQIARSHWSDIDATRALVDLAEGVLDDLAEGETMSTTKLVIALMPEAGTKQMKCLVSHLHQGRSRGLFEGYWDHGKPNGGTFGKPSIVWRKKKKVAMTQEERLKWIKENDPETFEMLYGKREPD